MTDTMIERVKAAMVADMRRQNTEVELNWSGDLDFISDGELKIDEVVRAAIAAMREPTEGMTKAGETAFENRAVLTDIFSGVFGAMIDAALNEKN